MVRQVSLLIALVGLSSAVVAAGPQDSENDDETAIQERLSRLSAMRRRATALTVEFESSAGLQKAEIIETPLLRYSNPAAEIVTPDATVWAWGRKGRPVALASVEPSGCEIVSLTEQPVSATAISGRKWSAKAAEIRWNRVPDSPPAGETAALRARQMKEISKRFAATGHYGKGSENLELRLLDRHLHRYADLEQGIIDGAIYAFTAGTNPEVLLLVECRKSDTNRREWFYGCTRLSAGGLEMRLDNRVAWTCQAITRWSETAPYSTIPFSKDDVPTADKE